MSEGEKTFLANIDAEFYNGMEKIDKVIKHAWDLVDERIAEIRELEAGQKRLLEGWKDG